MLQEYIHYSFSIDLVKHIFAGNTQLQRMIDRFCRYELAAGEEILKVLVRILLDKVLSVFLLF